MSRARGVMERIITRGVVTLLIVALVVCVLAILAFLPSLSGYHVPADLVP